MSETGPALETSRAKRINGQLEDLYQILKRNRDHTRAIHDILLGEHPTAEEDKTEKAQSTGFLNVTIDKLITLISFGVDTEKYLIEIKEAISLEQSK